MESFSESAQLAKVAAGMKGGPFFSNPVLPPQRTFVDGIPSEVKAKLNAGSIPQSTPIDPWYSRKQGK